MCSYDYLNRCKNFAWTFFVLPLLALIVAVCEAALVLGLATRGREYELSDNWILYMLITVFISLFIFIQILICFLPTCCHRKQVRYINHLLKHLKEDLFQGLFHSEVLFMHDIKVNIFTKQNR
jgi:low affinity Fe/Cu permease